MSPRILVSLAVLLGLGTNAACAGDRLPLRVLYAGRLDDERRKAEFVEFLEGSFEHCTAVRRDEIEPERLQGIDVLVLDWSQQEREREQYDSPLGPLENWSIPTVLLGSAGLLIAGPWEVIGGAG